LTDSLSENLPEQDQISSPGTVLKRCREYHGISLAEAAEATKIGVNYLTALENGKTGEFASIAYLKGFLRIYSSYLGLNPDDMLRLFERLYEPQKAVASVHRASSSSFPGKRNFQWKKLLLPCVLFILLVATSVLINKTPPPTKPMPVEPSPPTTQIQPARSSSVLPEVIDQHPQKTVSVKQESGEPRIEVEPPKHKETQPSSGLQPFVVSIRSLEVCRLAVTIDGAPAHHYELGVGDIIEWKAQNSIGLDISNADGVEVLQNGKKLAALGQSGQPVFVVLEASGIKTR